MSSTRSILATITRHLLGLVKPRKPRSPQEPGLSRGSRRTPGKTTDAVGIATVRLHPDSLAGLVIGYSPDLDGAPDAGEVIWTWVPYEEGDGRGKDRPVLVIGRQSSDRVYAVRMTSRAHEGDRDYLSVGTGAWDSQRRESWVDIEQLYSVHDSGMRREAAVLPRPRFDRVASALKRRYGWGIDL